MLSKLSDSSVPFKLSSITQIKGATKGTSQTETLDKNTIYMWLVWYNSGSSSGGWNKAFNITASGSYKWITSQFQFGQSNNHWGVYNYHAYAFVLIQGDGGSCTLNTNQGTSYNSSVWYQLWRFNK